MVHATLKFKARARGLLPHQATIVLEIAAAMPRHVAKADLPQKNCLNCGRPFSWRKKWEKVWADVRYCSEACKARRGKTSPVSR